MATITTKFGVGDTVWHANITTETKAHPCPDCLGSREWEATSPAGAAFKVPCLRCSSTYQSSDALNLRYQQWVATAQKLTIGTVRANAGGDRGHEYMCLETGIGSGALYYEDRLFETEEAARRHGKSMADANNADAGGWVAKQYDRTAQFCDYQLKDAEIEAAKSASRRALYDVAYLIEDLEAADSLRDVRDRLATWREERPA